MQVMRFVVMALVSAACTADPVTAQGSPDTSAAQQKRAEQKPAGAQGTTGTATAASAGENNAVADFKARLDAYMDVRKQAMKDAPPLKESEDPGKIKAAQDALAARIRALRPGAKQGDILTGETQAAFRRLLQPEMKGEDGRDAKAVMKDDAPAPGQVTFLVNARYPEGTPLPTVPPTLLRSLPILPKGLEYRFIGKDLVLLDMDAQIIVDFMRNAIR